MDGAMQLGSSSGRSLQWLELLAWLPECHLRSTPLWSACILDGVEGVMQAGEVYLQFTSREVYLPFTSRLGFHAALPLLLQVCVLHKHVSRPRIFSGTTQFVVFRKHRYKIWQVFDVCIAGKMKKFVPPLYLYYLYQIWLDAHALSYLY
jgi:hypothetical protein